MQLSCATKGSAIRNKNYYAHCNISLLFFFNLVRKKASRNSQFSGTECFAISFFFSIFRSRFFLLKEKPPSEYGGGRPLTGQASIMVSSPRVLMSREWGLACTKTVPQGAGKVQGLSQSSTKYSPLHPKSYYPTPQPPPPPPPPPPPQLSHRSFFLLLPPFLLCYLFQHRDNLHGAARQIHFLIRLILTRSDARVIELGYDLT